MEVVGQLAVDFVGAFLKHLAEHVRSYAVGGGKVGGVARAAYPAEWTESVVEEERAHDVLHIRWIAESFATVGGTDVGSGARCFEQEGVAVVEEIHSVGCQAVDGGNLAAQGALHGLAEGFGIVGHHGLRLLVA